MPRTYSYADAVKLLGAGENRLLGALDRLAGGALLGGATFGLSELLGWFDAKADFVRTAHELLVKAGERRSGLSRYGRTERLQAAHTVIVVVAFFEALPELPRTWRRALALSRERQLTAVGVDHLFTGRWPLPSAAAPYEEYLTSLRRAYEVMAHDFTEYLTGLELWYERWRAPRMTGVPDRAVAAYQELLRQLAGEYPELRFWFQVEDAVAARAALARLEADLGRLLVGGDPDARRRELAHGYRAVLERPVISPDDVPAGLDIPPLGDAYVDPDFEVVLMSPGAKPSMPSWWGGDVRSDLHRYLTGYLTSPEAVAAPLLVLGDPGSGKSMLTKVLAARLPARDFLAVRVELRGAPAEGDVLEQVEHGLRVALQERLGWAEFARSAGDALPVILLDGLDELVQATGTSQSRYLLRVERFQRDRADVGQPVAVVVTSRMSAVGGVQIPVNTHVLRLHPFSDEHIGRWLEVWNAANRDTGGVLPVEVALRYRELARQPLLLLMLALYDAEGNALQHEQGTLREAELYERLLTRFARREVSKDEVDRSPADLEADVEAELDRLSVAAFAMFNRGVQWISEDELDADLDAYLGVESRSRGHGGSTPLSAGEAVIGRFFFVRRAEAVRDSRVLRTYEFLHATFGEYLVARFTWRVLSDLLSVEAARPRRLAGVPLDDSDLYALLSFTPLTSRRPVLGFLAELAASSSDQAALAALLKRLHADSADPNPRSRDGYRPVAHPLPTRYAVYDLNLVLLYAVVNGEFDEGDPGTGDWPRLTAFWKSQLPPDEWDNLIRAGIPLPVDRPSRSSFDLAMLDSDFTGDPVAHAFRYPIDFPGLEAQAEQTVRATHELARVFVFAPPEDRTAIYLRWAAELPALVARYVRSDPAVPAPVLRELASTGVGEAIDFWQAVVNRLGRGDEDRVLVDLVATMPYVVFRELIVDCIDAGLRLHEQGFQVPHPHMLTMKHLATVFRPAQVGKLRPDLVTRLRNAGVDL